jgi:protein SCO1/2
MASESEQTTAAVSATAPEGSALRRRDLGILVVFLIVAGALAALLIGGRPAARGGTPGTASSGYAGLALTQSRAAPTLELHNYLGVPFDLAAFRGKAVLVTFLYTHCPDVCPLIASKLHTALTEMSARERHEVELVAVSVDPRGDTPATVAQFLAAHELTGQMQYLLGSAPVLSRVWRLWGVGSRRDSGSPELVAHTALIYGITGHGRIKTIYSSSFAPSDIVRDVPRLAAA